MTSIFSCFLHMHISLFGRPPSIFCLINSYLSFIHQYEHIMGLIYNYWKNESPVTPCSLIYSKLLESRKHVLVLIVLLYNKNLARDWEIVTSVAAFQMRRILNLYVLGIRLGSEGTVSKGRKNIFPSTLLRFSAVVPVTKGRLIREKHTNVFNKSFNMTQEPSWGNEDPEQC